MEKDNKIKISKQAIRRIIIAVFCLSIGWCISVVMFYLYKPSQNSLVALSSVCMDLVCILILFIIISSFAFGDYVRNHTTRMFSILLIVTIWALFLDFLNWAFDGSLELGRLTFWFTLGSLCTGSILACIFALYLNSYIEEMHEFTGMRLVAKVCAIMNVVSFIVTFALALSGAAFKFVDGHYVTGTLYDVVTVLPVLSLLIITGFVVRYIKKIGAHDVFAVAGYMFFMIAGAMIEAGYNIGTTYVAVAIADIFIYVMLQNEVIATEKRHVEEWKVKSNTDELTGFNNRHAYEADMKLLEDSSIDENFVYVSVDVNSLKKVNDSYGHIAGDEMLIGASECLKKSFGLYGKLYRIGGDEFVALIFADEKQLEFIKKDIVDRTGRWTGKHIDSLALSCGYVTKAEAKEMPLREMAVLADQRMYEAKDEYYRLSGIDRRKV